MYADHAGLDDDVARAFVKIMRIVDSEKLQRTRDKKSSTVEVQAANPTPASDDGRMQTASKEAMMAAARRRVANVKKVPKGD